jgi:undecaprenyl-diphosphatase
MDSNHTPASNSFLHFFERWLKRRWQSLLFLMLGVYLPLFIFVILAVQIWQQEGGLAWDVAIMTAIHATSQTQLDSLAATLTKFGTRWGVIPASVIISLILLYQNRWRSLTYFLITGLGCGMINPTAKTTLHRVRPRLWEYPALPDFSFPSGHAMASMVFVVALGVLTWGTRWWNWVLGLGSLFVVVIGWTRLYLGVHYPSDILAGWMLSLAWAIGVAVVVKPYRAQANAVLETTTLETAMLENQEGTANQPPNRTL